MISVPPVSGNTGTTEALIAEARKALEGTTPGPWDYVTQGLVCEAHQSSEEAIEHPLAQAYRAEEDGVFIAWARHGVERLAEALEGLVSLSHPVAEDTTAESTYSRGYSRGWDDRAALDKETK